MYMFIYIHIHMYKNIYIYLCMYVLVLSVRTCYNIKILYLQSIASTAFFLTKVTAIWRQYKIHFKLFSSPSFPIFSFFICYCSFLHLFTSVFMCHLPKWKKKEIKTKLTASMNSHSIDFAIGSSSWCVYCTLV